MSFATDQFCRQLGIDLPLIQAPMAGVQDEQLAIAVCNAGGLGSLPCAMLSPEQLSTQLEKIQAATPAPYNVNFFCHKTPQADVAAIQRWQDALSPYYQELQIDPDTIAAAPARRPFDQQTADLLAEFTPAVISFHFGLPDPVLMQQIRRWKPLILASATTLEEAIWLERNGADMIIAQGLEAGGHRGHFLSPDLALQMDTLPLLQQIVSQSLIDVSLRQTQPWQSKKEI